MPKVETSSKPQDSRAAGGGLVDPRDLKDNSSEPLPLPDEPATEPRGDDDRESSGDDRVRSPACGIVDPRLIGSDPTTIAPPEEAEAKQDCAEKEK